MTPKRSLEHATPILLAAILGLQLLGSSWGVIARASFEDMAGVFLAAALLALVSSRLAPLRQRTLIFCVLCSLWFGGVALDATFHAETLYQFLALPAHATRWCLPLLLWWSLEASWSRAPQILRARSRRRINQVARWALAATFAAHGLEALLVNPEFIELLTNSSRRLLAWTVPRDLQRALLTAIGLIDLLVAALLLLGKERARGPLAYMLIWGFITAASRSTSFGLEGLAGTLLRSANWGLPLVLLIRNEAPPRQQETPRVSLS